MNEWRLSATKGLFRLDLSGFIRPEHEAQVHAAIAAMREGLEANGYTVEAKITLSTEVAL